MCASQQRAHNEAQLEPRAVSRWILAAGPTTTKTKGEFAIDHEVSDRFQVAAPLHLHFAPCARALLTGLEFATRVAHMHCGSLATRSLPRVPGSNRVSQDVAVRGMMVMEKGELTWPVT